MIGVTKLGSVKRAQISWCIFDWANSAYPTLIVTFIFSAYFTTAVAPSPEQGTVLWGYTLSASCVVIAIIAPFLGAIADHGAQKKSLIGFFTLACAFSSAGFWFVEPSTKFLVLALILFALSNVTFELGTVIYNSLLPDLAPRRSMGRLSGIGWGLGYGGGLCALFLSLVVLVYPQPPLLWLDRETAEPIRMVGPLVALWITVFSIPLFLFVPERTLDPKDHETMKVLCVVSRFFKNLSQIKQKKALYRFFLARLFYADGLNTLFAFGGVYAAGTFGMTIDQMLIFGIAINISAGLGAAGFGWIEDFLGSKKTILIALISIFILGTLLVLINTSGWFWVLGISMGIFMGPAQSASRSLLGKLAPQDQIGEMFGLFALSGKVTSFLGPAIFAGVTHAFNSQRAGMATVLLLICFGAAILITVPSRKY